MADGRDDTSDGPVTELAILDIRDGESERFESAFHEAVTIISSMPGCRNVRLERCLETADRYMLLVEWDRLADHTEGFRGSVEYERWKALLHHFYEPLPTVEHYSPLVAIDRA
jgi:heme-degrading monooxygenase HmoA